MQRLDTDELRLHIRVVVRKIFRVPIIEVALFDGFRLAAVSSFYISGNGCVKHNPTVVLCNVVKLKTVRLSSLVGIATSSLPTSCNTRLHEVSRYAGMARRYSYRYAHIPVL